MSHSHDEEYHNIAEARGFDPRALVVNNDDGAPDGSDTTNSMDVGDQFFGELDYIGDWDWIKIEIDSPQTILFTLDGRGGSSAIDAPLLALYSEDGIQLGLNEDGYSARDTDLEYTFYGSGTYYIVADTIDFAYDGQYILEAQAVTPTPIPAFDVLDTLDWGTDLASTTVDVFFANAGYQYADVDFGSFTAEAWNAYELAQFQEAFDLISSVTNLTFNIVQSAGAADFILINDNNDFQDDTLGFFNPPGEPSAGTGVFNSAAWDRVAGGDLELGGNGFVTIMHEVLHGLGLAHPHDTGSGTSTVIPGVEYTTGQLGAYTLNQGLYTTMTYNAGFADGPIGVAGDIDFEWGYEVGPMALDIAVLQQKYGANTTYNSGNDTYDLKSFNSSGTYWMSIWDTGGTDTIQANGFDNALIDLRAATLQDAYGGGGYLSGREDIAGGFTIANGVAIENARGGFGDDKIVGNYLDNVLDGNSGNDNISGGNGDDTVIGGDGDDILYGGNGTDTLDYGLTFTSVEVYLNAGLTRGSEGNDRISSFENIIGSFDDDRLIGDAGNNFIEGGSGNDIIKAKGGDNTLYGGFGDDTIRGDEGDDLIYGGDGIDILFGLGGDDLMDCGDGDDFVYGGRDADEIIGGEGDDRLRGNIGLDTLYGGFGEDDLRGGSSDDMLYGGEDDDFLLGENFRDTLDGGAGDDVLIGGSGGGVFDGWIDTFVYKDVGEGGGGYDRIRDFEDGIDVIDLSTFNFVDFSEVFALSSDRTSGLRIDLSLGGAVGDILLVENFEKADFDASDVILV